MNAGQNRSRRLYWAKRASECSIAMALILLVPALLLGCSATAAPTHTPTATSVPTATPTATNTPTPSPTPTDTPSPTPTPTPGPLSSAEILKTVSPSVAFIELPTQSGSGFLFGDGYIVTNAHVVWPFEEARVVFSDGEEHQNVAVANWDMLYDLAVLGPIETKIDSLSLVADEEKIVGDDVYLIGYPGEVDTFPQPTIARGLISRIREWEPAEMTYYQVDARFGHGQSGGVLVSDRAEIAGVANFLFDESGYGLVASAVDVKPHLDRLISTKDEFAQDVRRVSALDGKRDHNFVDLYNESHVQTFVLDEPKDTDIEIEVDGGDNDIAFYITSATGEFVEWVDQGYKGVERYRFTTMMDAPYYVSVVQFSPQAHQFSIGANRNLIQYRDFDDNRGILVGDTLEACIDYPGDNDHYLISLGDGDRVNIMVDAIMIDPHLSFGIAGNYTEDDDSGGGVFGLSPELTFAAADPGTYSLRVSDSWGSNTGCYTLHVREPYAGAPAPVQLEPFPEIIYSDYGDMLTYESTSGLFSLNVPAGWNDSPADMGELASFCDLAELCLAGDAMLMVSTEDLGILSNMNQDEYVEFYRNFTENFGFRVIDQQPFETRSGQQGTILELSFGDVFTIVRFMFVHENTGINVAYALQTGQDEELRPLIEYTFRTFAVAD